MVIANPPLAEPVIDPGGVTIKPPFEMGVANLEIGNTSADFLLKQIDGVEEEKPDRVLIPCTFKERESVHQI